MKFAVGRSLDGKKYEDAEIGPSLIRVLKYSTMKDKFTGIHPILSKIGITRVEITEQGLVFIGNIK